MEKDYKKLYEDSLARMQRAFNTNRCTISFMNEIFPETKESEDEKMKKIISDILLIDNDEIREILDANNVSMQDIDAWIKKQAEQKSAWTPMDEQHVENLLAIIEGHGYPGEATWLNSLENRVQPQQEWSEEDENMVNEIILDLKLLKYKDSGKEGKAAYQREIDWLKVLKDRVQSQNNVSDKELAQAKKDAYNDLLDKIEYYSGEPTFSDGWDAAIWYLKKRNAQPRS